MTRATVLADPTLERAAPDDAPRIAALLAACAPETIPLGVAQVRARLARFHVLRLDGTIAAVAALHPLDDERTELRSVAVDPLLRGRGMGRAVVSRVVDEVRAAGRTLFCFTFRPGFFARLGFREVADAGLPRRDDRPQELHGRKRRAMVFDPDQPRRAAV